MEKRGLSTIVTTLLIILLVIIAIGVIWAVVRNVLQKGSENIGFEGLLIELNIRAASIDGDTAYVQVKREAGEGDLVGINFVFSDTDTSKVKEQAVVMTELEQRTFTFSLTEVGISSPTEVSVAPIYELSSGKDKAGEVTDTEDFGTGVLGGGDGGGGAQCGNNNIEGTEVCDGSDIGTETCITQGFDAGDLACLPDCTGYDTSSCTGGTCTDGETQLCPLQDGVCLGSEQTCTGSAWPGCVYTGITGYEATEVSCTDTLDNDCDRDVDTADSDCELTWTGTVGTPWPTETKILFDIVENTADFITPTYNYVGMYMSFSGTSIETRCIMIFDYVIPSETPLYDKSIVRLDGAPTGGLPINIAGGNTFTIWQKSQCGV